MVTMQSTNSKPYVVLGEAQESDSEEEIDSSSISKEQIEHCKGKVISGEAPESDEESYGTQGSLESVSSATSALSFPPTSVRKKSSKKHQSILIKKLYERNMSLTKNINEFVAQTATNAGNELNATNQKLLKCQLQMQEGAESLRTLNSNLSILESQLQSLLSLDYLPEIRIVEDSDQIERKPP